MDLQIGCTYLIRLCSGELRRWRHEGSDARGVVWWRDMETGIDFSENSLMYVWEIVSEAEGGGEDDDG